MDVRHRADRPQEHATRSDGRPAARGGTAPGTTDRPMDVRHRLRAPPGAPLGAGRTPPTEGPPSVPGVPRTDRGAGRGSRSARARPTRWARPDGRTASRAGAPPGRHSCPGDPARRFRCPGTPKAAPCGDRVDGSSPERAEPRPPGAPVVRVSGGAGRVAQTPAPSTPLICCGSPQTISRAPAREWARGRTVPTAEAGPPLTATTTTGRDAAREAMAASV